MVDQVVETCDQIVQRLDAILELRVCRTGGNDVRQGSLASCEVQDEPHQIVKLGEELDACVLEVDRLRDFINAATHTMVAYEKRRCEQCIRKLETRYDAARAAVFPKARFQFKHKNEVLERLKRQSEEHCEQGKTGREEKSGLAIAPKDTHAILSLRSSQGQSMAVDFCTFDNQKDVSLYHSKPNCTLTLQHLNNCSVFLCTSVAAIKISNLTNCRVYCGPVSGSVHVSYLSGCELHFLAHQVRIHTSRDCHFFLSSPNAPILEHCSDLVMSRAVLRYKDLLRDCIVAGLESEMPWKDPIDFSWLADGERSPNWAFADYGGKVCWVHMYPGQDEFSQSRKDEPVEWR